MEGVIQTAATAQHYLRKLFLYQIRARHNNYLLRWLIKQRTPENYHVNANER